MRQFLLTAFAPFDGQTINPSWEMIKPLDGTVIADVALTCVCLPVVFGDSVQELEQQIQKTAPAGVISFGQAGGRTSITPECIAINLDDARIADNAGNRPCGKRIIAHAPDGYFSTLPIKTITQNLQRANIPCQLSYTAGTFVCNHLFFGLQHLAKRYHITQSGFIHIPYLPSQATHNNAASMSLDTLQNAAKLIVQTVATTREDIAMIGGQTH